MFFVLWGVELCPGERRFIPHPPGFPTRGKVSLLRSSSTGGALCGWYLVYIDRLVSTSVESVRALEYGEHGSRRQSKASVHPLHSPTPLSQQRRQRVNIGQGMRVATIVRELSVPSPLLEFKFEVIHRPVLAKLRRCCWMPRVCHPTILPSAEVEPWLAVYAH